MFLDASASTFGKFFKISFFSFLFVFLPFILSQVVMQTTRTTKTTIYFAYIIQLQLLLRFVFYQNYTSLKYAMKMNDEFLIEIGFSFTRVSES